MVELIKASVTPQEARIRLMERKWNPGQTLIDMMKEIERKENNANKEAPDKEYQLSEQQARDILDMRLQRLTGLEQDKILEEYRKVNKNSSHILDLSLNKTNSDNDKGRNTHFFSNSKFNLDEIFLKVGFYPDYIHVDFVDKTMNEHVEKPNFDKFEQIKNKWPNHRIESHIMSKNPIKYIDHFSKYSDVIYFHYEIDEEINKVRSLINKLNIETGLVLHASRKYDDLETIINPYKEVLILCIEKPGESGQNFLDESTELINKINNLKIRSKFNLCVDGGLSQKNISKIECEKIVSASNVFKNENPKKQITYLQKILNN